ncbi:hypothetical protein CEW92_05430 [Bacillaceae bacterium SAS-127]|nr:hypothetical protein CEW92_05430 [Bacillaceae bacterium SAS-127]
MYTLLSAADYEKMIHFASIIAKPTEDKRSLIQRELATQFGYDESIFWYADEQGNLFDPQIYGFSDKVLFDYINEFSHYDFLHPQKNFSLFQTKRALRLSDLVNPSLYEDSTFYYSFMKPYGYYDEMVICLFHEGTCIGVIGLARQENSGVFTSMDRKRFQLLSDLIAANLSPQQSKECPLLSKRENEVVQLLKDGKTNQAIARELFISQNTVKKHIQNIFQKYNVQNRTQLVRKIWQVH